MHTLLCLCRSIRHLQEASQTDGKAAINLQKLKIFRHFYILVSICPIKNWCSEVIYYYYICIYIFLFLLQIVCYIYFTRIIVYLLAVSILNQKYGGQLAFTEPHLLYILFADHSAIPVHVVG